MRSVEHRWWMIALFVLSSIDVLLTRGRTGYLVWFLLISFVLVRQLSWKACVMSLASLMVFLVLLAWISPAFMSRTQQALVEVSQVVNGQNTARPTSLGIRTTQLTSGVHVAMKRPWLGYGTRGQLQAYAQMPQVTANDRRVNSSHNSRTDLTYINVLVEHGVVGLVILFGFIGMLWWCSYRLPTEWRLIGQCLVLGYFSAAMFTAFLISSFAVHFLSMMLVMLYGGSVLWRSDRIVSDTGMVEA